MVNFPNGRFDGLALLASTLGNFWTEIFGDSEFVYDLLRAFAAQERQLEQTSGELYDSIGRATCPVYHKDLWLSLELNESEGLPASFLDYGGGAVYGAQPATSLTYAYGTPADATKEFPAPAGLKAVYLITDAPSLPAVCLTSGVDFFLDADRGKLVFLADPFADSRLVPFFGDDGVRRLRLSLFMAESDLNYVPLLYGSVLGLRGTSSNTYKALVNASLDAVATGSSASLAAAVIEAASGVRLAVSAETVEAVTTDASGLLIVTDKEVYRFAASATPLVAVGARVVAGDPLVDAVVLFEPNSGVIPAGLSSLAVSKGLLGTQGELVFQDAELPLTVTTGVSGKTKVTFSLGGFQADVDAFFTEAHARGVTAGKTLANYLDLRPQPQATEPTALNLPATLNPLRFLFTNFLRYGCLVVLIRPHSLDPEAGAGLDKLSALRRVLPPHATALIVFLLPDVSDNAEMAGTGGATSTGYDEAYELFTV